MLACPGLARVRPVSQKHLHGQTIAFSYHSFLWVFSSYHFTDTAEKAARRAVLHLLDAPLSLSERPFAMPVSEREGM
jgi:hypothetical protein